MFARTSWGISTWNSTTVGASAMVGIGGGALEIGLVNGSAAHNLSCIGACVSVGIFGGVQSTSLPLGFRSSDRTQWGRLYKNNMVVPGQLTFDLLRNSSILAVGAEVAVLDEGQSGYLVVFSSGAGTAASIVAAIGGYLSIIVTGATCRAVAFLATANTGFPGASGSGYRYRITGGQ